VDTSPISGSADNKLDAMIAAQDSILSRRG
jgi:hypothetical protein